MLAQALLAADLYGQGALTPPGAPAPTMKRLDEVEARIIVNATNTPASGNYAYSIAPAQFPSGGSFYLTGNLAAAQGGIFITASNVTPNAFPRITAFTLVGTNGVNLTFTSSPARLYTLETTTDLVSGPWSDSGLGTVVPAGNTTTLSLNRDTAARRFYRVRPQRPLP